MKKWNKTSKFSCFPQVNPLITNTICISFILIHIYKNYYCKFYLFSCSLSFFLKVLVQLVKKKFFLILLVIKSIILNQWFNFFFFFFFGFLNIVLKKLEILLFSLQMRSDSLGA